MLRLPEPAVALTAVSRLHRTAAGEVGARPASRSDLRRDRDLTLVIATHDPAVAAIAGRVLRLVGGRLVEDRRLAGEGLAPVRELER